jgi:hypothetical protein
MFRWEVAKNVQKSVIQQNNANRIESSAMNVVSASWKDYFQLAKPRMVATNLITAFGGFWVASQWSIDWSNLVLMLLGAALVLINPGLWTDIVGASLLGGAIASQLMITRPIREPKRRKGDPPVEAPAAKSVQAERTPGE